MKLAFIVQRYGREILGGSETLARQLAERLSRRNEITVLTTTAKDYISWKNEYSPGEEKIRGVRVLRFPVTAERDLDEFNRFSQEVYGGKATREQELEWLERQGPVVPELIDYLKKEQDRFDLLIFFTYLYYPTYYGLAVAPEKSILVPTAHDEPPLKLGIFREMFQLPSSYIFNTEAEELLVLERFPVHKKMRETIGMGMELLDQPEPSTFRKKHDIPGNYLLYAGRIDGGKNLEELFRYFTFYKEEYPASGNLQLILIGKLGMKLPEDASVRYIGFVDEGDKLAAMAGALAVVQPSRMESLSIVTLEALSVGSPVLVNAESRVLVDHCRRSNAGFYYRDFEEFEEILNLLFSDRGLGRNLGRNGQRYIKDNFGWSKLLTKYELVFRASARPSREPRGARPRTSTAPEPAGERSTEEASDVAAQEPDERAPEVDERAPEVDERAPEVDERAPEVDEHVPEVDEHVPEDRRERVPEPEATAAEAAPAEAEASKTEPVPEPASPVANTTEVSPAEASNVDEPELPATAAAPERRGPSPEAEVESTRDGSEELARDEAQSTPPEPVDEDIAHLPSFYRSAVPPKPPVAKTEPQGTPEAGPANDSHPHPEAPKPAPPVDEAPLEEGELPVFYRPRPKGSESE